MGWEVESVGGGDTWTLLLAPWGGVETADGDDT